MRVSKPPEERRTELITAARELFDRNGVDKTRVSDIVKKVGVAQGVFYYYFASKTEMVEAVAAQASGELKERLDVLLEDRRTDFCGRLARWLDLYIGLLDDFLADDIDRLPDTLHKDLAKTPTLQCAHQMMEEALLQLIEQGAAGGDVTAAYPRQAAIVTLHGLLALAAQGLPKRALIAAVAEQNLGLPQGGLARYMGQVRSLH